MMKSTRSIVFRTGWLACSLVVASVALAATPPQDRADVRRLFEAGRHAEVVASVTEEVDPGIIYMAALSQQKIEPTGARPFYERLTSRPDTDPWHMVGLSGLQMLDHDLVGAVASARQAVALSTTLPDAHYHLGLALGQQMLFSEAAAAFDLAAMLAPSHAYAHYYAGLMFSRINRVDRMANHFERFLKLAPEAPERPAVLQIMRTVRGR